MTTLQISIHFSTLNNICNALITERSCLFHKFALPTTCYSPLRRKISSLHAIGWKLRSSGEKQSFLRERVEKSEILIREEKKRRKRATSVVVRVGFGSNGGGGDGNDNSSTTRLLGNLALAIGLAYLSVTGQLGWVLDAIVSIWLLAVILPIAGLGAFLWFAGRDIVQDSCPNCGNEFQIFKSSLKDGVQLCPFCTQPFSVQDSKFVRESARSSNQATTFGRAFNRVSTSTAKGKSSSATVVDIEAEVKDID